jgi:hypothetical protein
LSRKESWSSLMFDPPGGARCSSINVNIFNARKRLAVTVTTRVEEELAKAIDDVAKEEGMDRSTVIRGSSPRPFEAG